jgi:hypothetical protein
MSKLSCYGSSWATLLMVAMGQGMLPLQLQLRQESLSRPITGFMQPSPSLDSYIARRCRRLFIAQQLHGDVIVWWANYTATHPADYQVSWIEFRSAFCAHYILAGVMTRKNQEFMDLKRGGRTMHDYSKLFNHLAQYAPYQVDMDDKKKNHFMIGLSMKL